LKVVALNWRDLAHPSAGGAEVVIDRLLKGLAARGHDVSLVCGGPVGERDYEVVEAGGTYTQYLKVPWVCVRRFRRADLIIDSENGISYFSPLWRRGPTLCLMHHVHTDQWATRFPPALAYLAREAERRLIPAVYRRRLFVAVSSSTARDLEDLGVKAEQIRIIESGVDSPAGPNVAKSPEPLFVALTRLVPHKRVPVLLEAWRRVEPVVGGRFVVIGDGPELGSLRRMAAEIPGVELTGWIDEADKWRRLGEAWFLVNASHHEGWGLAIMEAAAAGTPALVVDARGVRDCVVDGDTGVLVGAPAERDLPAAVAAAWIDLAADAGRRARLGDAAKARAAQYSWDKVVERWIEVATEAVAVAPVPRTHKASLSRHRHRQYSR
jgi:glycosyltransferase involved in cell wall biosynthesis